MYNSQGQDAPGAGPCDPVENLPNGSPRGLFNRQQELDEHQAPDAPSVQAQEAVVTAEGQAQLTGTGTADRPQILGSQIPGDGKPPRLFLKVTFTFSLQASLEGSYSSLTFCHPPWGSPRHLVSSGTAQALQKHTGGPRTLEGQEYARRRKIKNERPICCLNPLTSASEVPVNQIILNRLESL